MSDSYMPMYDGGCPVRSPAVQWSIDKLCSSTPSNRRHTDFKHERIVIGHPGEFPVSG